MLENELQPTAVTEDWWITVHSPDQRPTVKGDTGKWLVFVPVRYVDHYWQLVRQAVMDGKLGPTAKVATARPNHPHQSDPTRRPIVVYTADAADEDDVRRVLTGLRTLGISWRITYKTDADTTAGVYGCNAATYISPSDSVQLTRRKQRPSHAA